MASTGNCVRSRWLYASIEIVGEKSVGGWNIGPDGKKKTKKKIQILITRSGEVCRGSGGMDNASSTVDNFADRIWI